MYFPRVMNINENYHEGGGVLVALLATLVGWLKIWKVCKCSLGGSIFHFWAHDKKTYFLKNFFTFAISPAVPIFPIMRQWARFAECDLAPKNVRNLKISKTVRYPNTVLLAPNGV